MDHHIIHLDINLIGRMKKNIKYRNLHLLYLVAGAMLFGVSFYLMLKGIKLNIAILMALGGILNLFYAFWYKNKMRE